MHRDSKSQLHLWDEDDVNEGQQFYEWLCTHQRAELVQLLSLEGPQLWHPFVVDIQKLQRHAQKIADLFLTNAQRYLERWDQVVVEAERTVLADSSQTPLTLKPYVHVRIHGFFSVLSMHGLPRSLDVGRFMTIRGTVVRAGAVKLVERQREIKCGKCGHQFVLQSTLEKDFSFPEILICPGEEDCASKVFSVVPNTQVHKDYQELKVQEQVQLLEFGSIPRSMHVILEDDLVDTVKAGDDVMVSGIVVRRWKSFPRDDRPAVEIVFYANRVILQKQAHESTLHEELIEEMEAFWTEHKRVIVAADGDAHSRQFQARAQLVDSVCPQLYGKERVKLALLLVLIGGVPGEFQGSSLRGQCHLLLVGDAGMGKSQFLQFAAKLSMRSVMTTGVGSTSAGLTVAASRGEGGDWGLEAGALVLADGGVCCIDEFDSISKHDASSIHEAMEQCSLSVAKAGMVCKLDTRCSVIAAMNAKGKYDPGKSIAANTAIASPLLSRFDLILVLQDVVDEQQDALISQFILNRNAKQTIGPNVPFKLEKLRAYVAVVKSKFHPTLDADAQLVINAYYARQRRDLNQEARTTIRSLEGLVRLTQAHARLMWRNEATYEDACEVCLLMEYSPGRILKGLRYSVGETFGPNYDAVLDIAHRELLIELELLDKIQAGADAAPPSPPHASMDAPRASGAPSRSSSSSPRPTQQPEARAPPPPAVRYEPPFAQPAAVAVSRRNEPTILSSSSSSRLVSVERIDLTVQQPPRFVPPWPQASLGAAPARSVDIAAAPATNRGVQQEKQQQQQQQPPPLPAADAHFLQLDDDDDLGSFSTPLVVPKMGSRPKKRFLDDDDE